VEDTQRSKVNGADPQAPFVMVRTEDGFRVYSPAIRQSRIWSRVIPSIHLQLFGVCSGSASRILRAHQRCAQFVW